jgi:hypothetical protein
MQALALLLSAIVIGGCTFTWPSITVESRETIRGSGDLTAEEREVSGFSRISITGFGDVVLAQGDTESLTVETDDNLMQYVETRVSGRTLTIGFTDEARNLNLRPSEGITFDLHLVELEEIDISGAGNVEAASIEGERLEIDISGAGDVEIDTLTVDRLDATVSGAGDVAIDDLTADRLDVRVSGAGGFDLAGEVREQDVTISGMGGYRAGDLQSRIADVSVPGAGDATVWVTGELDVRISGLGDVDYYGSPTVNQSVTGLGELSSLGEHED